MNRVGVRPELLRWARERSDRDPEYLRRRFPKLDAWELGDKLPTLKQLEDFARATYTPVGYFFLDEPPIERLPVSDFRTIGAARTRRPSPNLLDTLYLCQQRQYWYQDEARTAGEPPVEFVGSLDTSVDVGVAGARLRDVLGFGVEQRSEAATWTDALRLFVQRVESVGALVMVSGVVGSNTHRPLNPEEFRGFALSDSLAPLVFVNGADTKAAQMFTLAHEVAHLSLDESGVSNPQAVSNPDHEVERWCNHVAAELLVPAREVRAAYDPNADLSAETGRLARHFKVSTLVTLRSIHDAGWLGRDDFRHAYRQEIDRLREIRRSSGGDGTRNVVSRVSKRFARALAVSVLEGRTSYTEAFRLMGIRKASTFESVAASLVAGV